MQLTRQHPLLCYFLLAFGLTWAYELLVFGVLHASFSEFWVLLFTFGPTLAAFLITAVTQGRAGILQLLRRYVFWRVGITWYLLVLLGVPALLLLPSLIQPGAFSAFRLPDLSFWLTYLVVYLSTLVFGGPLGEEGGWRGFALPHLEQRSGPLVATLLLGVLWGLWHLPLFLLVPRVPRGRSWPGHHPDSLPRVRHSGHRLCGDLHMGLQSHPWQPLVGDLAARIHQYSSGDAAFALSLP